MSTLLMAGADIAKGGWSTLDHTLTQRVKQNVPPLTARNLCRFVLTADLLERLERLRGSEKTVGEVAPTLQDWVSEKTERDG